MRKLYNSSAAFAIGNAVYTDSPSGCLRSIVISAQGIRTDIAPEYQLIGATHEHQHMRKLGARLAFRERSIQRELTPHVTQSGRMDFGTTDGEIHETKATSSEYTKRSAIGKGEPKANHVAQLVTYLINTKTPKGRLIYGYYEENAEGFLVLAGQREIEVAIDEAGNILIDGATYEWTVADQLAHTTLATAALEAIPAVPERPANAEQQWGSPCGYCTFKSVCDRYDAGQEMDFFDEAREAAAKAVPAPVKIKRSKK